MYIIPLYKARRRLVRHGGVRLGIERSAMANWGEVRRRKLWPGPARRGRAWCGKLRCGEERRGVAR